MFTSYPGPPDATVYKNFLTATATTSTTFVPSQDILQELQNSLQRILSHIKAERDKAEHDERNLDNVLKQKNVPLKNPAPMTKGPKTKNLKPKAFVEHVAKLPTAFVAPAQRLRSPEPPNKKKRKDQSPSVERQLDSDGDSVRRPSVKIKLNGHLSSAVQMSASHQAVPSTSLNSVIPPASSPHPKSSVSTQQTPNSSNQITHQTSSLPSTSRQAFDFSLPYSNGNPYLTPLPRSQPLQKLPLSQLDVHEDFSNAKAGNQVPIMSFWTGVDPYLAKMTEEDLGFLAFQSQDMEPYQIPALGAHCSAQWDSIDTGHPPPKPPPSVKLSTHPPALRDEQLSSEDLTLGPLSERLMAALVPCKQMESGYLESPATKIQTKRTGFYKSSTSVLEMEDRLKSQLISIGLFHAPSSSIGESSNSLSASTEDPISATLKILQMRLKNLTNLNNSRKSILHSRATDWLAYNEYLTLLESLERAIETGWTKRLKSVGKNRKKKPPRAGADIAINEEKDKEKEKENEKEREKENEKEEKFNKSTKDLTQSIERRTQLQASIGAHLDAAEAKDPGKLYGLVDSTGGASVFGAEFKNLPDDV